MELNIKERLVLLGVMPEQGNFLTLKVVRKLREELSFSEDELTQYNLTEDQGRITWDESKEELKDVTIGDEGKRIIKEALEKLDREEKLRDDHVSLYEKFIEED